MTTHHLPTDIDALKQRHNQGERFNFFHFWGHRVPADGSITQSCFSQWYPSPLMHDGTQYATAEHFMMASKARLFNNEAAFTKALNASSPNAAKRVGREVRGFNEATWVAHRTGRSSRNPLKWNDFS